VELRIQSRWLQAAAVVFLLFLAIWAWPMLRPAFSGGVRAAADLLARTGGWGPLLVVALQLLQAVISPLPSWPITVAAGALYGPVLGTAYSLIGATLGATINFLIARHLGLPFLRKRLAQGWLQRVGRLRAIHFLGLSLLGRALPFASFDLVAYLAGISQLSLPLFLAVAALGQGPAIFAYAYLGGDLAAANQASTWGSLAIFVIALLVIAAQHLWNRFSAD